MPFTKSFRYFCKFECVEKKIVWKKCQYMNKYTYVHMDTSGSVVWIINFRSHAPHMSFTFVDSYPARDFGFFGLQLGHRASVVLHRCPLVPDLIKGHLTSSSISKIGKVVKSSMTLWPSAVLLKTQVNQHSYMYVYISKIVCYALIF